MKKHSKKVDAAPYGHTYVHKQTGYVMEKVSPDDPMFAITEIGETK